MVRSFLVAGVCLLWPIAAQAESGPRRDAGVDDRCVCNDDCGAAEVCVVGSAGARVCCPGSAFDDCPAEPGAGIMCVDAGPLPPEPDSGPMRADAGTTTPPTAEDDGCSAGGSIAGGAAVWAGIALVAALVRRRRR